MVSAGAFKLIVEVRIVSMRVAGSVLSANGRPCAIAAVRFALRCGGRAAIVAAAVSAAPAEPLRVETLPDALVRTYQGNPQLNAERARLRGVDETVPQALAGYRPQVMALLTGGLQQVRSVAVWIVLSGNSTRTCCSPPVRIAMICGRYPAIACGTVSSTPRSRARSALSCGLP